MSQKTTARPTSAPSRERAEALLRAGQIDDALRISKEVFTKAPNAENLNHRKLILTRAAEALLDSNKPILSLIQEAESLKISSLFPSTDPAWTRSIAGWLARSGRFEEALACVASLQDSKDSTRLTHLLVDQAVRQKSNSGLPGEHHAGLATILGAFQSYEANDDEKARESLQSIGLQSPFLEWKVFLRGLIAYASQDHTRAIENWDRLDSSRLPAKLAAPLRLGIDADYRASLSDMDREALQKRSERLMEGNFLQGLRTVRQNLGREGSLATAFRDAGAFVVTLKRVAPDLFDRLGQCFYHAIIHHGQPQDLARYRSTFGPPVDDPMFDRLEALVFEQEMIFEAAHKHWQKYANWLAAHPPGWPKDVADRARAIVWFRMALNAHVAKQRSNPLIEAFSMLFAKKQTPANQELKPDVYACLKQAIELAPNWSEPSLRLMQEYYEAGELEKAVQTARKQLERTPEEFSLLRELGVILTNSSKYEQAVPVWQKALALQPLDQDLRTHLSYCLLAEIRKQSAKGDPAKLRAELATMESSVRDIDRIEWLCLDATLALKAGEIATADSLVERAFGTPHYRLAAAYRLAVEASFASLKPALKTKATKRLKEALAADPTPRETLEILRALSRYQVGKFTYRGEKSHEKQALALVARCLKSSHPLEEYRDLGYELEKRHFWKELYALGDNCCPRFTGDPAFPYFVASAMFRRNERPYRIEGRLNRARFLTQKLDPQSQKSMMEKIEALEKLIEMPSSDDEQFGFDPFDDDFDEDDDD